MHTDSSYPASSAHSRTDRAGRTGVWSAGAFAVLAALGAWAGLWKLLGISGTAFAAMAGGALLGIWTDRSHARGLVWGYGLASGAMITSAAVFLVPPAIGHHPEAGGFGVALGIVMGFAMHTVGHQLTHHEEMLDAVTLELTMHALAAGAIIGVVYAAMPELGLLLGLAIVSHKGPAGYAAARRLARQGHRASALLLPASAVGLTALPAGLLAVPEVPALNALVFGFAAGIFLHVAMDFLPHCELGGEIHEVAGLSDDDHHRLDQLRLHAAVSTALGGTGVFIAWVLLSSV